MPFHVTWQSCSWYALSNIHTIEQSVKSVQIQSFFVVRIFLYSVRIQENTDQKKLRFWALLTTCEQ